MINEWVGKIIFVVLPISWIESDRPRGFHIASDECPSVAAIEPGHFDLVQIGLYPVEIEPNPVDGEPLGGGQPRLDHHLDITQG